jgi:hypothetical protein
LDYLPLRTFDPAERLHLELAALSRRLHAVAEKQPPDGPELAEIDRLSGTALKV